MSLARTTFGFCAGACLLAVAAPRLARVELPRMSSPAVARLDNPASAPSPVWTGIEIPLDASGHYRTDIRVDGFVIPVLVDTGATFLSLTAADAERIGVRLADADFKYQTATANGVAAIAVTTLHEVQVGSIRLNDVKATVARGDGLGTSLLGMSFLNRLSKVEASNGRLLLRP